MAKLITVTGNVVDLVLRKLEGREVMTTRELQYDYLRIPAGTVCVVTAYRGRRYGLDLESKPCKHCGVVIAVHYVKPVDILLVESPKELA